METRIGGIYGLAQVAEHARNNNGRVGGVLLAFVNRQPRPKSPPATLLAEHAADIQAALTVLTTSDTNADHRADYEWITYRLDLHGLGLRGANLEGASLAGADLHGADFTGAVGVNLAGVRCPVAGCPDSAPSP